jgi:hypothetical protein
MATKITIKAQELVFDDGKYGIYNATVNVPNSDGTPKSIIVGSIEWVKGGGYRANLSLAGRRSAKTFPDAHNAMTVLNQMWNRFIGQIVTAEVCDE